MVINVPRYDNKGLRRRHVPWSFVLEIEMFPPAPSRVTRVVLGAIAVDFEGLKLRWVCIHLSAGKNVSLRYDGTNRWLDAPAIAICD